MSWTSSNEPSRLPSTTTLPPEDIVTMKSKQGLSLRLNLDFSDLSPGTLAITISPGNLIHIGPNLEDALFCLVVDVYKALDARKWSLLAITYSLSNLTIVLRSHEIAADIQLYRIRRNGSVFSNSSFQNPGLSRRIELQLQSIFRAHATIVTPFRCFEDWDGIGYRKHPIYERMLGASVSMDAWRAFRHSVCSSHTLWWIF